MFDSPGTLKHLAFFEELAGLEESDPNWRAISAGLVVLRLVDAWIEEGARAVAADSWGTRAVRTAIGEMSDRTHTRAILLNIVDALEGSPSVTMHSIGPRILAYGQALEYDGNWTLAADVYETLVAHTHPVEDSDVVIMAHLRLGLCYRELSKLDLGMHAYETAGRVANAVGDVMSVLRARIGEAQLLVRRGNLPRAQEMLDDAIARACGPELLEVRSRALHARSNVAYFRGEYELAVQLAYEALDGSGSVREKDRILGDIAASFMELGVFSAARDAYLVLSATAQEQYVRWGSTLNLLEIAARELMQPQFERYRRELESTPMTPHMAASLQLSVGQGYQRFGDTVRARAYLERARDAAERIGLAQLLFQTEESLAENARSQRQKAQQSAPVPEELEEVAQYVRALAPKVPAG